MGETDMTLDKLPVGQTRRIAAVGGQGALRRRLLDMGLTPKTQVTVQKVAPMGDPIELRLRGYELTLLPGRRAGNCAGSAGRGGGIMVFALAGNKNCGKTTLFNQLTGSNQHVGNFPGVTVEQKSGIIRGHRDMTVVDLPGIYSIRPYTSEEIVTRDFLLSGHPDGIINIIDATNIERNLYLTLQLIETGIPMVLALNMMDEVRSNGGSIDVKALSAELGIPVVPISAAKNEGIEELISEAERTVRERVVPKRVDFCSGAVHRCITLNPPDRGSLSASA